MAKKITITELKKQLKNFSQDELIYLVTSIYKKSDEAVKIINSELQGEEYDKELLDKARQDMYKIFFPTRLSGGLPIANAKKVITSFDKCCSDTMLQIDLKLYFVECGVEFTNTYGDICESFYNSVGGMFWKVADLLNKMDSQEIYDHFEKRLVQVVHDTQGIGWGFHDELCDALCSLKWFDD